MRVLRSVVAAGLVAMSLHVVAQDTPEQMAQRSDQAWLSTVDAARYPESWEMASTMFRSAVSKEMWVTKIGSVREPLGRVESRKLQAATYSKTLPGAPDGEYVVAKFRTSFEHKRDAVETVVSAREKDGSWRLAGYFIA